MPCFLIVSRLFCRLCIRGKEHNLTKKGRKQLSWDMEVLACFRPGCTSMSMEVLASCKKNDFEIRPDLGCTTIETSRKVVLDDMSVCLSVCEIFRVLL